MKNLILALLLGAAVLSAQSTTNSLTAKEAADGWLLLFDGNSMFGWTSEGDGKWRVENGTLVVDSGGNGWLRNHLLLTDYVLKCDFKTAADGNSGIFLRSAATGQPHVTGYELQIYDTQPQGFNTGGVVNHVKADTVAKLKDNQWMSYEVEHIGDRMVVKLDGKKVLDMKDPKSKAGHIGLQFNQNKPIVFRNIKVKPVGLQSIFDGKTLNGWKVVEAPRKPAEPPVWKAEKGMIHVEKGPGQLETDGVYQNFILQMDVRTNSKDPSFHPNSGIFFRGDHAGYWTGYEAQLRNEFKDADPTQPVDFGTGAIYHYFPTRKVVSKDNEFFKITVHAHGRHMAVWVNGYPTADWTDERPEGKNARSEARLTEGTLSLQAHDPKTNLDFKNIQIAKLP